MQKQRMVNPWLVCVVAASFFFYEYIQLTGFNVLKPHLIEHFGAKAGLVSFISSMYFYGTVLFIIPAGVMLDNLSTRKIILSSMLISLLAMLLFTFAPSIYMLGVARFLLGASAGPFCFVAVMRLVSRWFEEKHLALISGIVVASGMLGGIISQAPFDLLINNYGWRHAMLINIAAGGIVFLALYLYVKDYPADKKQENLKQMTANSKNGFTQGVRYVMSRRQNWYCGLFASLLNLPIFIFGALWGMMYLTEAHNLSHIKASIVCGMIFCGMLVGAPTFGYLSDKMRLRKLPMLLGVGLCFLSVLLIIDGKCLPFSSLLIIFFLLGFGSSSQTLAYPTITETNPLSFTGSALSLASLLIMLGGATFQPIVGWMIEHNRSHVILLNAGAILVSGVFALLIKETYCRRKIVK